MATLTDIAGIGPKTAETLSSHGFSDVGSIAGASAKNLATVPGFSEARAARTIKAAKALMNPPSSPETPKPVESKPAEKAKEGKKTKGKKKDKKKDKKKKDKKKKKNKKNKKK